MVTPIRRIEFILGKTIPFFVISTFRRDPRMAGSLWFGVPLRGSIGVFGLGHGPVPSERARIGLFISTVSRTQQQAMTTAFFFFIPSIIFSGFGTPISNMPEALQSVSYLDPLRYFQEVLRSVYLKGAGLKSLLWQDMAGMALLGVIMLAVSVFEVPEVAGLTKGMNFAEN